MSKIDYREINQKFNTKSDLKREDERFLNSLSLTADRIIKNAALKPFVLFSGPSGSGKTTSAGFLRDILTRKGQKCRVVSLDNYFRSIDKDLIKTVDLESPERVDSILLSEHIEKMLNLEEVETRRFDFLNCKNEPSGVVYRREEGEVVIFEGIHALNPSVVKIPDHKSYGIYASVTTEIRTKNGALTPNLLRFIRRLSRDALHRGRNPEDTAAYFESVELGEKNFVAPFIDGADEFIDTFIGYEPKVYSKILKDEIGLSSNRLINKVEDLLSSFDPLDQNLASNDSLISEFVFK